MISFKRGHVDTQVRQWKFPDGCMGVDLQVGSESVDAVTQLVSVKLVFGDEFTINDNIIALALTMDALRRQFPLAKFILEMPYIPYARQDRAVNAGEPNSLKVIGNLINGMGFEIVHAVDPHSTVADAAFNKLIVSSQVEVFRNVHPSWRNIHIVAPDAGATKKCEEFAKAVCAAGVITCAKNRDKHTGQVTGMRVIDEMPVDCNLFVLDDICDGGRTFIEVAKALDTAVGDGVIFSLELAVTHGLFTKGVDVVAEHFDTIYTTDSYISERNNAIVRTLKI